MATVSDVNTANQAGNLFRVDLNEILLAITTGFAHADEPDTTYPNQIWFDLTANRRKQRNNANDAWVDLGPIDTLPDSRTPTLTKSSGYTAVFLDRGSLIDFTTAGVTLSFDPAATLAAGWYCYVRNSASSGVVTLDPDSSEQIDGANTQTLQPGEGCLVVCTGSAFKTIARTSAGLQPVSAADTSNVTLASADGGKVRRATDAVQYTLPSAGAVSNGAAIRIKSLTEKSVTVIRAGSDTIDNDLTSFRIPSYEQVEFTSDGVSSWVITVRPAWEVGDVREWATNTLPKGWAWVNGQALSRTNFGGLFAVWSTTYGAGDGSTTFNVRDDRGRVKAVRDNNGGITSAGRLSTMASTTLGAAGGAQTHTLTTGEMPTHRHTSSVNMVTFPGAGGSNTMPTGGATAASNDFLNNAGGGAAHNNIQPTIMCNSVVKT